MSKSILILEKVICRGGLIGTVAKQYINDEGNAEKFLLELAHQLKTNKNTMREFFGSEIIDELENLSEN